MENDDYLSRFDKFYSSHGTTAPFSEIRMLEVEDRENYTDEEFDNWMSKYNISPDSRMIWVTPSKGVALSYYGPPTYDKDWEGWKDPRWGFRMPLQHIESMMGWDNELAQQFIDEYWDYDEHGDVLDSFDASNLVLIPESHDGDDGFLAMVKPRESFEKAWEIMKAPFIPYQKDGFHDEPFEGTLYSGGDKGDSPEYWTTNPKLALAYALFGSAIPRKDYADWFRGHGGFFDTGHAPPLRQTVPTIRVSQSDPDWDDFVEIDPHSGEAFRSDTELSHTIMPQQEVLDLIDEALNDNFFWHDSNEALYGTTARHHTADEITQHMLEAKERLATGKPGRLNLPEDAPYLPLMSFGESDNIEHWIDEPPSELENWQLQRLIQDTMFEGLPHATQEHFDELNRRKRYDE